jgi:transcriptional regulator with XRE-family HTH domain
MPHRAHSYGVVIRKLRLKKGMTLRELADGTGLSVGFLSRLERGERDELSLSSAVAVCDTLAISLDQLVGRDSPTKQRS